MKLIARAGNIFFSYFLLFFSCLLFLILNSFYYVQRALCPSCFSRENETSPCVSRATAPHNGKSAGFSRDTSLGPYIPNSRKWNYAGLNVVFNCKGNLSAEFDCRVILVDNWWSKSDDWNIKIGNINKEPVYHIAIVGVWIITRLEERKRRQ